jgi:hypothetical protein
MKTTLRAIIERYKRELRARIAAVDIEKLL